jgi:hypothetical protein
MQWRGKILFAMILYAAGFFTAIYVLTPSELQTADSRNGDSGWQEKTTQWVAADAPAWTASVRGGMSKVISFAEEQALRLAETIKTQMAQSAKDTRGD